MNKEQLDKMALQRYGHKFLNWDEYMALPEPMRKTRNCKEEAVGVLTNAKVKIDNILTYIRSIPVLDDESHAELVERYTDIVCSSFRAAISLSFDERSKSNG